MAAAYNTSFSPSSLVWCSTCNDVGWYWTAPSSMTITEIETNFGSTTGQNVTIELMSDRGGADLASETFNSNVADNTLGGAAFGTPYAVTGGTQYFIGMFNVESLGINAACFPDDSSSACASATVLPGYEDSGNTSGDFATSFGSVQACTSIDCPILELFEPSVTSTTPEPGTLILLGTGLFGMAGMWKSKLRKRFGRNGA